MTRRAVVVLNPAAGRGLGRRLARPLAEAFAAARWEVEMRPTTRAGEERALAAEAARAGWPLVIAAGGDGTVHGVANGLLDAEPADATMGVVAIGTGNDFAKLAHVPVRDLRHAVGALERAEPRRFDVGWAGNEYFTNGLGVGFGPAVLEQMTRMPRLRGFALYLGAIVPAFLRYQPRVFTVEATGHRIEGPLMLAEVAIGTTAGGGFRLTPDADPTDGLLDVCAIRAVGLGRLLRYVPRVMRGAHGDLPFVTLFRTDRVRLAVPEHPLVAHLDGELRTLAGAALEVSVVPQRLSVLCAP